MEIKELVGEHMLDAVDFSREQVKKWGSEFASCQVMRFRLDGKCYIAAEDQEDGYRSHMRDLTVIEGAVMKNVFTSVMVAGRHRTKGSYGSEEDDILELIDVVTGRIVLEVGTEDVSNDYPGFVASFHPEAMAPNSVLDRG